MKRSTDDERRAKLHEIIEKSRTVMLLTHGAQHQISGRPMAIAKVDPDSTIYLVTSVDSAKVDELSKTPSGALSIDSHHGYALINADIRVSQDRALIDELWRDDWRVWFPDGKADTTIALLVAIPIEATYWQQDLGHGLSYLYRAVRARITHHALDQRPGDQERIDFRR